MTAPHGRAREMSEQSRRARACGSNDIPFFRADGLRHTAAFLAISGPLPQLLTPPDAKPSPANASIPTTASAAPTSTTSRPNTVSR